MQVFLQLFLFFLALNINLPWTTGQPQPSSSGQLQVSTIRTSYRELGSRVSSALRMQIGDAAQLQRQYDSAESFLQSVERHGHLFDEEEFIILRDGIYEMISALGAAISNSQDASDYVPPPLLQENRTGRRGRPRKEIDPALLELCLRHRGPTHLAPVFGCSSRTIRRRALDHNLVEPCPPVYVEFEDPETGERLRFYKSSTAPMSTLADDELDTVITHILEIFPAFGRRMIDGHLQHLGHRVPRERIRASYERVVGSQAHLTAREVQRQRYRVAGPNALWHHDGQHTLIRWRVVIHAFVDGYSRMVTAIQASDNNRADTVLALFLEAIAEHGTPSRVRGDHGVENLGVAEYMESNFGVERGSYIWGRSVHNIRIERLWRDVTAGFGMKWYNFFFDLELRHGLVPDIDGHIWLLHHLFLPSIDQDAAEWAGAWNSHRIRLEESRDSSPNELFIFGALQDGLRDPTGAVDVVDDIASYGVDWADLSDSSLLRHHNQHNQHELEPLEPHHSHQPPHLNLVEVPEFEAPFDNEEQATMFFEGLEAIPEYYSRNMNDREQLWTQALRLLRTALSLGSQ
ncbi:hypothetical protein VNI00_011180 [Paramarasmius palmivorus]|uniref:Integrase catalytic domain-containing protein n=1 Tax=Paramarasmius palmivorus TaxID=297713 RepID=A0AAW0CEI4_9AGAR